MLDSKETKSVLETPEEDTPNIPETDAELDLRANFIQQGSIPGQCQVFLTSNQEFVLFVEEWSVVDSVDA